MKQNYSHQYLEEQEHIISVDTDGIQLLCIFLLNNVRIWNQ